MFPLKKLYALDVRVNSLDPAWPIKLLPPTVNVNASIHVNPKFLKQVCMFCKNTSVCRLRLCLCSLAELFKSFLNLLLGVWTELEHIQYYCFQL